MRLYVGNLAYAVSEESLRELFEEYGTVESATVVTDRETRRSRGFGFVEMPDEEEARRAIEALEGTELEGRALNVNEARPRPESRGRGFGGGRRSGGRERRGGERDRW